MHTHLETIVCKFGCDPAIYLVEEAICAKCLQTDGPSRTQRDCISSRKRCQENVLVFIRYALGGVSRNMSHKTSL